MTRNSILCYAGEELIQKILESLLNLKWDFFQCIITWLSLDPFFHNLYFPFISCSSNLTKTSAKNLYLSKFYPRIAQVWKQLLFPSILWTWTLKTVFFYSLETSNFILQKKVVKVNKRQIFHFHPPLLGSWLRWVAVWHSQKWSQWTSKIPKRVSLIVFLRSR